MSVKVEDIYLITSQLSKYPSLFTPTSVNNNIKYYPMDDSILRVFLLLSDILPMNIISRGRLVWKSGKLQRGGLSFLISTML